MKDAYSFMQLGAPPPRWRKCGKPPTWYAREVVPGKDGRRGAMSLCDECKAVCEERAGDSVQFESLVGWNEKFHQLYENKDCVPPDEVARVLEDAGADVDTAAAFAQLVFTAWRSP